MRKKLRVDPFAALTHPRELPRRLHQVAVLALERRRIRESRKRLAVVLLEIRLVVETIDVRNAARAENLQHTLRLGLEMRTRATPARSRVSHRGVGGVPAASQQTRQCNTSEASAHVAEEASTWDQRFT